MDKAHIQTDKLLNDLERDLKHIYSQAYKKCNTELKKAYSDLSAGKGDITKARQIIKRNENVLKRLTVEINNADLLAAEMLQKELKEVAGINVSYASDYLHQKLKAAGVKFNYSLYNHETIKEIVRGDIFKDIALEGFVNKDFILKTLKSNMAQSILLGESIGKMADRIQKVISKNRSEAIKIARTENTKAENSGRDKVFRNAQELGIEMKKRWIATSDNRTRQTHKDLDGVVIDYDKPFDNGCDFPGVGGSSDEVVMCRCTFTAELKGVDY